MPDLDYILQSLPHAQSSFGQSTTDTTTDTTTGTATLATVHINVKLALIGATQTGKSTVCNAFLRGGRRSGDSNGEASSNLPPYKMTIGMEVHRKTITTPLMDGGGGGGGGTVHFTIMDVSGQPRYQALLQPMIAAADAYLFVFDLTRRDTMEQLRRGMMVDLVSMKPDFAGLVVGTRGDLVARRAVSREEAEQFADEFRLAYVEVGGDGSHAAIAEAFGLVGQLCIQRLRQVATTTMEQVRKTGTTPGSGSSALQAPPRTKRVTTTEVSGGGSGAAGGAAGGSGAKGSSTAPSLAQGVAIVKQVSRNVVAIEDEDDEF